jgi:hypothetical protein
MRRSARISVAILVAGLGSSVIIYATADELPENPFAEYENSKRFLNAVERMGGKTSVLANEMGSWFSGLWQGQQLAFTVAVISAVAAALYYFVASGIEMETKAKEP